MTVTFTASLDGLTPAKLGGFFEGWTDAPDAAEHLAVLRGSDAVELALDGSGRVIGFAAGITDGVMTLFITLVEVLPEHRGQGIGAELVRRLSDRYGHLRYCCLHCDPERVAFYERLGYEVVSGVQMLRFRDTDGCTTATSPADTRSTSRTTTGTTDIRSATTTSCSSGSFTN